MIRDNKGYCDHCGIEIKNRLNHRFKYRKNHFCCMDHSRQWQAGRVKKIERECLECGNKFMIKPSIVKKPKSGILCSYKCRLLWMSKKMSGVRHKENTIINNGIYCEMRITNKNRESIVLFDLDDLKIVNKYTWGIGSHGYAITHESKSRKVILMHRLLANTPDKMDTDHINHNICDNRKANLRVCTTSQNMINIHIKEGKKYKGVYKSRNNTFYAKNANKYLGTFATPELAAQAYNETVEKRYGEFAQLNKI
jgi:hypothetical protein